MTQPKSPPSTSLTSDHFPLLLAILLALSAGAAQLWLLRDFRQLPSGIFGGDYTYQMGCIRSILASGNPMASCSCSGALPGYLPFYGTVVALFVKVTGLPVDRGMLLMSALIYAASVFGVYLVMARHFGKSAGLAMAALWAALYTSPILKYTEFTAQLLVPFYFDALLLFIQSPRARHALYLGLMLAALGYAHTVAFVSGIVVATASSLFGALWRARTGGLGRELLASARGLAIVAACAALAIGYWYRPIFVHHGRTSLHYVEWNGGVLLRTLAQRLKYARGVFGDFYHMEEVPRLVLHALFFVGLFAFWRTRERERFVPVMLAAALTFAWMFHYFVTMPLLHTHFVPEYVRRMMWAFALLLVAAIPVALLFERVRSRGAVLALQAAVVIAALVGLVTGVGRVSRDQTVVWAREPLIPQYAALQAWVLAYTHVNDVVLSSNELSYAWSALTGRKAVVSRRAQNDPFLDMDERNRDAALMLYGHDEAKRRALLARWNVSYLLWTADWAKNEFPMDSTGNVFMADPMLYFPNPAYDAELEAAGVKLFSMNAWVDPAMRGDAFPKFDLTIISPQNYVRASHPWRMELDSLLQEVWSYPASGWKSAILYRVRR